MHELSIAMSLLDIAEEEAQRQGNAKVLAIHVKLGPLSGVIKEALLSAYELARENSLANEAELVIEDVPVRVFCPQCQNENEVSSIQELCCAECGTPTANIVSGRELEMTAMEFQQ